MHIIRVHNSDQLVIRSRDDKLQIIWPLQIKMMHISSFTISAPFLNSHGIFLKVL